MNIPDIDKALGLDDDTRAARDRLLAGISGAATAEQVWELYRQVAIPAGAPLVQLVETRRAIFWALSAAGIIAGKSPERFNRILEDLQRRGMDELKGRMGR